MVKPVDFDDQMATQVIKRSPNFCHDTKRESGKTVAIQYFSQLHITAQHGNNPIGKDEVASSNLASSSKKKARPKGWAFFLAIDRFEPCTCNSPVDCCLRRLDGEKPLFSSPREENANKSG